MIRQAVPRGQAGSVRALVACLLVLVLGALAPRAASAATIRVVVDGEVVVDRPLVLRHDPVGRPFYAFMQPSGDDGDRGDGVTDADFRLVGRLETEEDVEENGYCIGSVEWTNLADEMQDVQVTLSFDACPLIDGETMLGSVVGLRLVIDDGGGLLYVPYGRELFTADVDGDAAGVLYPGPYLMHGTGSGIIQTSDAFGTPLPSAAGPPILDGFGLRLDFRISAGEKLAVEVAYVIGGSGEDFVPCAMPGGGLEDGAGGLPGAVLSVLGAWGACDGCPEDRDLDGDVDASDLVAVLLGH